jgi:predicted HAD superfamily phosphohydrolase YqeG
LTGTVSGTQILDGTIMDVEINATAGIQQSKLATLVIGNSLITDVAASKLTGLVQAN